MIKKFPLLLKTLAIAAFAAFGTAICCGQSINVDFANAGAPTPPGPVSSTFGAAANQPGFWNTVTQASTGLFDLGGNPMSALLITVADDLGGFAAYHEGDLHALLDDNFFSEQDHSWTFSIVGLTDGIYDFYYYAPANGVVDTGTFDVNNIAAPNVIGDDGSGHDMNPLIRGFNWELIPNVVVSQGVLTVTSTSTIGYRGLAGFQLQAVPEPGTFALATLGVLGIAAAIARNRRRPRL